MKNNLKAGVVVDPVAAIQTLSEWGNTLTSTLVHMQQQLAPLLAFSTNIALPLTDQVSFFFFFPFFSRPIFFSPNFFRPII